MNIPKGIIKSGTTISYSNRNYKLSKDTSFFGDVGDSDTDNFEDYPQSQNSSTLQMRWFSIDGAVKAEHTTMIAVNGERLKINHLLKVCHKLVKNTCEKQYEQKGFFRSDNVPFIGEPKPNYKFTEASDWVFNLGILAKFKASSEINPKYYCTGLYNFKIKENGIKLHMEYEGTERMFLSETFFQDWNNNFPDHQLTRLDLRYIDINNVNQFIISFFKNIDPEFSNSSLAGFQIERLKFEQVTCSDKIYDAYNGIKSQWRLIVKYLDFLNALMFGLEASRANATLLTGVMTLELIQAGHMTYKKGFYQSAWGGQFPLATIGSGSHNFSARSDLLKDDNNFGMKKDRRYPTWLAITCKESIIIKNWFNMKLGQSSKNFSVEQLNERFELEIKGIIKDYYKIELQ